MADDSHPTAALRLLLDRAERERDRAAGALGAAQQRAGAAQAQARELDDYRREHDRRWTERFRVQATPEVVGHRHHFGQRLDSALAMQDRTVRSLEHQLARSRGELIERERRVAVVRRLIEAREREAAAAAARREQRATDDFAQRSTARGVRPQL